MSANTATETLVPLAEGERADLKKSYLGYWAAIIGLLVLTVFLIVNDVRNYPKESIGMVILWAVFAFATALAALICLAFQSGIGKDLKVNQKKIITGLIEDKRMSAVTNQWNSTTHQRDKRVTMSFRLTVDGKEYFAPDNIYLDLRVGDLVAVHVTPNAEKVLRWEILEKIRAHFSIAENLTDKLLLQRIYN